MTQDEASDQIFKRWRAMWPSLSGDVPYSLDNIITPDAYPHARVAIVSLDSNPYTIARSGNAKVEREGLIQVMLHGQVGIGRRELDLLANHVRAIFERKRFGGSPGSAFAEGIVTTQTSTSELRRDRESPHVWILTASTDFRFYDRG